MIKKCAGENIKNKLERVKKLRHELHRHAELSNNELKTKSILAEYIKTYTSFEIKDCGKWFYAFLKNGDKLPSVAFRADMDALPIDESISIPYASLKSGISHKCGHDGHCASLALLADELSELECCKNVFLVFQHAEETGEGGRECASFLSELEIDEIYSWHNIPEYPLGSIIVRDGIFACASKGIILSFSGTESHAAYPESGRNPAFAVGELLGYLRDRTKFDVNRLLLCTVINVNIGQRAFGTAAGRGDVLLTLRSDNEDSMEELCCQIYKKAVDFAKPYEIDVAMNCCDVFPETRNHIECVEKLRTAVRTLNLPEITAHHPFRWSEDFGYYLKSIKGAYFGIGSGEGHNQLHTCEYDFPDEIMSTASKLCIELLKN